MQLIVTCAGCGAKYRGESSPKKFRCAACSNLFTFPEKPMTPSTGTILCSNCWTETVPTEKLKACGFCSQRVSPRYGGQASEDKQLKLKQPNVRTDLNLVKAATNKSNAEIPVTSSTANESSSGQFTSNEWKELGGGQPAPQTDHRRTQAFELLAELKKELEPEMAGVVESMQKSQDTRVSGVSTLTVAGEDATRSSGINSTPQTASGSFPPDRNAETEASGRHSALEAQLETERGAHRQSRAESDALQARIAELEERVAQETALREAGSRENAVGELQGKVAELSSLVQADKRTREQLLRERTEVEERWRERDAKVAELNARLTSDSAARAELSSERDQLREFKHEHEAHSAELESRLGAERSAREALLREHTALSEAHKESSAKLAELSTRLSSDKGVRDTATRRRDEMDDTVQELSARLADLETRLGNEKRAKDALIHERDQLSDGHREVEARVADLETRWHSEREAKEGLSRHRDELLEARGELDARVADLESRLASERQAKESASTEREKLHELRKELEAKTADLTRRHANEREAKERALKEHSELSTEHHELSAKFADTRTRLKSEQDGKEAVRRERDEALTRANTAESRIEKSEAEVARLRKGLGAHAERMSVEFTSLMGIHAARVAELAGHARASRKRLEEEALNHSNTLESGAAELKARMEQDSASLAQRLSKLVQDHQDGTVSGQSGRQAALSSKQSGRNQVQPDGDGTDKAESGRMPSASLPTVQSEAAGSGANKLQSPDAPPDSSSSSRHPAMELDASAQDKSSGTFWAKVFKRPATKVP